MINKGQFGAIKKELINLSKKRERIMQDSREVINLSKQIIHTVHRDDFKPLKPLIKKMEGKVKNILKSPLDLDINRVALQEYVEAMAYYHFIKYKTLISKSTLKVDAEAYLLGLADLSGELVRRAGAEIIRRNHKEAERIKKFVNLLYGEFIKFDLRGSELRKKSDALRWNLKKLEEIMLDFTRAVRRR